MRLWLGGVSLLSWPLGHHHHPPTPFLVAQDHDVGNGVLGVDMPSVLDHADVSQLEIGQRCRVVAAGFKPQEDGAPAVTVTFDVVVVTAAAWGCSRLRPSVVATENQVWRPVS